MAEVQNIGAVDYNQFQPNQYQTVPEEDMANMPVVYDEATEEKKKAGLGMLGATILGATMLVVGGLAGKHIGAKGAEKIAEEAKTKAEEALKKYEQMQEATAQIEKEIKENNELGFLGRFKGFQRMKDKISEIIKPFRKEAEAVENKAAEAGENAAKKAEEAAKDTENTAK